MSEITSIWKNTLSLLTVKEWVKIWTVQILLLFKEISKWFAYLLCVIR